jgi:hypothetical protein
MVVDMQQALKLVMLKSMEKAGDLKNFTTNWRVELNDYQCS